MISLANSFCSRTDLSLPPGRNCFPIWPFYIDWLWLVRHVGIIFTTSNTVGLQQYSHHRYLVGLAYEWWQPMRGTWCINTYMQDAFHLTLPGLFLESIQHKMSDYWMVQTWSRGPCRVKSLCHNHQDIVAYPMARVLAIMSQLPCPSTVRHHWIKGAILDSFYFKEIHVCG